MMMSDKPHAVCIPVPVLSHVKAMLSVAKLLHQRGFFITFVITDYVHKRIIKSRGPNSLDAILNFQFKTIADGIMPEDADIEAPQDLASICIAISNHFLAPFRCLLSQLNHEPTPPVSCIVSDGCMSSFTIKAAMEFNVPIAHLWPISPCSLLGCMHFDELVKRGVTPFQDESYLSNDYLNTTIDWIPGMKNIKLKYLPSFIRTTDPNDIFLNFLVEQTKWTRKASAIILNTFDALDHEVLDALSSLLPPIYTIGPLHLLSRQIKDQSEAIATNFWEENHECITWLDSKEPNSVIYVNFGSITIMTLNQITEFAWGLANSKNPFLWIIRPDLVKSDSPILSLDFLEKTKGIGMIASWCAQEEVLNHPSIKGFLTHNGWNSTLESICGGVPMISWPYLGDQPTTCLYCCEKWGIALEIDNDVKRDGVENCIKELMEGKKGEDMKAKVMELKSKAEESYRHGGSSYLNLDKLITDVLLLKCYREVK
ncbi:7-deoxyloganetin glucosyltransferase-like [Cucurbita pepo subsp. pepo]|uniref:7-deoxyloganetin glucosyltransferase-like n=1 Tax=Cucurbita pepo subsp. pepo TaxID=3664 RepID=UPI000C9D35DA|nr:7-deoxyloganetin glucosyltransferase-like [Cucurbita pepo subsp. pepo]